VRNIFLFIRRYFNFLFFVFLQITALLILFRYNEFHEAVFYEAAHEITGRLGGNYNNITYYFRLKQTNADLAKENEALRNRLAENFEGPDTSQRVYTDTLQIDTTTAVQKYVWRSARVVNNTVSMQNNSLTIERGENQGVRKDMGVVGPAGVVGRVVSTSGNYAVVMSMLNRQFHISSKLKKTGEAFTVHWDGVDPNYVIMNNVPKIIPVAIGDTVVTSHYSSVFPAGIPIGTVAEVIDNKSSNFVSLRLKTATNFYNLEYVAVVENTMREEQKALEDATKINN
jgi:rod shape-determining protein MreC